MSEPRFQILGVDVPPMLGRTKIMRRMWNDLTKTTPSHLSVVGPRYAGKSVLLEALSGRMREGDSPYNCVIPWDLGHLTPRSDDEFLRMLCRKIGESLCSTNPDYGEHLLATDSNEYSEVYEVLDALYGDGQKILMLWDGFDRPLSSGTLTRNLWDNLLELCKKPSLRLVTSSRKELHHLIRDAKSVTSDFWGVFEGIVRVAMFDDDDIEEVLATLPNHDFQQGAKKELINWSAGFPPLLLETINQIVSDAPSGRVDNNLVNQAASKAQDRRSDMLDTIWEDCHAGAKDLYFHLVESGDVSIGETVKEDRACLIEKGLARQSGNKITASCRMLHEHVRHTRSNTGILARLFGTWPDYKSSIRSLLERRLSHISRFDDRLTHLVARAIEDIPDYPDDCLNNLTSIEEQALDLIWRREFGPNRTIPQEVIDYWDQQNPNDKTVYRLREQTERTLPADRGLQCGILQMLTGSRSGFEPKAKYTSKDTYVLINAIHSFRNRGQHSDGQEVHLGVAVAAIMTCIELLSCLERELYTETERTQE